MGEHLRNELKLKEIIVASASYLQRLNLPGDSASGARASVGLAHSQFEAMASLLESF